MYHNPVLLQECIEGLTINPNGVYVDVTYGGGGHSKEILKNLENGRLIAFDQDIDSLKNKTEDKNLKLINANFRFMRNFLKYHNALPVDGILADLGISSHQIDVPERGFSTRFEADLDMRMKQDAGLTARKVINEYKQEDLVRVFREYGELRNAYQISKAILNHRANYNILKLSELKEALSGTYNKATENKFLARVFQAIRIEVNQELEVLKSFLKQSAKSLKSGGRLVVISYHSLEDRLVKNFIKSGNFEGKIETDFFGNQQLEFRQISRKPIVPSEQEIKINSRARSARLRIAEKI